MLNSENKMKLVNEIFQDMVCAIRIETKKNGTQDISFELLQVVSFLVAASLECTRKAYKYTELEYENLIEKVFSLIETNIEKIEARQKKQIAS